MAFYVKASIKNTKKDEEPIETFCIFHFNSINKNMQGIYPEFSIRIENGDSVRASDRHAHFLNIYLTNNPYL